MPRVPVWHAPFDRVAVSDADDRQPVGWGRDPDSPGLARPLIESLECDAVMLNSDVDTIIAPPPGGLTGYRRAVELALHREARGLPAWDSLGTEPAEPLPSDPDWAGAVSYSDVQTATVSAEPADVRKAAEDAATARPVVLVRGPSGNHPLVGAVLGGNHGHPTRWWRQRLCATRRLCARWPSRPIDLSSLAALHLAALRALAGNVARTINHRQRGQRKHHDQAPHEVGQHRCQYSAAGAPFQCADRAEDDRGKPEHRFPLAIDTAIYTTVEMTMGWCRPSAV